MRKILLSALVALLLALPAYASEDATQIFTLFMEMAKSGELDEAIDEHGIDERSNNPFSNPLKKVTVPGELSYEVKDTKLKEDGEEAVISAVIEYETVVESTQDKIGTATAAGQALSGNVVGAAGSLARNEAGNALSSLGNTEKVQMRQEDQEWKVIVTDKFYKLLTGQK